MGKIHIDESILKSLIVLSGVVEARDVYTGGHIWRVSQYAKILADKIGLEKEEIFLVELNGLVHDLGKIGVPDSILNKNGKLTDDEYSVMKSHTLLGKNLIKDHLLSPIVMDGIYGHHERVDGKGYPSGNEEKEISIISRIIGIADAFDAMTSTRSYRKGMEIDTALERIAEAKGTQFDNTLANRFIEIAKSGSLDSILGHCGYEKPMFNCVGCGPIISYDRDIKDGESIVCPNCKGEFRLHKLKDTFELECKGARNSSYVPQIDNDVANDFIRYIPKVVHIQN